METACAVSGASRTAHTGGSCRFRRLLPAYADWVDAKAHIAAEGSTFETPNGYQQQTPWVSIAQASLKTMLKFCTEFGLTPSSRSRIVAANAPESEADDMEMLLGGDG
nr:phage terminase small subunit P27 family [uncultured Ruminococcus sp.]